MTRRGLMVRICVALMIYAVAIGVGCDLRFRYPKREDLHYVLYKDLVPLVVAIPAAWLAYCFQRRASSMQQLRLAWADAVPAARGAIRYATTPRPTPEDQADVLEALGAAIDGVDGLFRPGDSGPGRALESIRDEIEALGSGHAVTPHRSEAARSAILGHWEMASVRMLREFDRVPAMASKGAKARAVAAFPSPSSRNPRSIRATQSVS